jgi:glycosyltransferase EpsH
MEIKKIKISIIVPVCNVEKYLRQCLNSLMYQTMSDIEIIMINDGSTDNSGLICNEYVEVDERFKVIHQDNKGLSDARNVGLRIAKGDYIIFLDSDDWVNLDTCEITYSIAQKEKADIVFWSTIKEYPSKSEKENSIFIEKKIFEKESILFLRRRMCGLYRYELRNPARTDAINSAWGKLYKKDLFEIGKIEFQDTKDIGSEDVLFNFQIMKSVRKAVYLNEHLNHYRRFNDNSLTKNHKSNLFDRFLNLFTEMESIIIMDNLGQEFKESLQNRIALSILNVVLSITNPNNQIPIMQKIDDIDKILKNKIYMHAVKNLKLKYMPIHWRLFFNFCKLKMSFVVYIFAIIMRKLR